KSPNLRICYGYKNGELWLRHCPKEDIDFQVVTNSNADRIREELQSYRYNSQTGPMWCSRLLIDCAGSMYNMDKDSFPHVSQLFFGIHHAFADGITNAKICGCFIKVLNDIITGIAINEEQIGNFVSDLETDRLVSSKIKELQKMPKLRQDLEHILNEKGIGMPMIMKVFPAPLGKDKTYSLTNVFDECTTKNFIERSKAEDVTLNSAFTALTLAATVDILIENSLDQEYYRLCHSHVLNLRRYWSREASQVLGCHAHTPLEIWSNVPKNVTENFWEFSRQLHQDLYKHIREGTLLLREAYLKSSGKGNPYEDSIYSSWIPKQVDVCISNLGDVTPLVTEGGEHVRAFNIVRQVSLQKTEVKNLAFMILTLRGRLILNLLYNTKYTTKKVAGLYCQKLCTLLETILKNK
ncbi:hypothetical protein SK128_019464, partial [Halocaridina rubra]